MANVTETIITNSLPSRPLGRFSSHVHVSLNMFVLTRSSSNFPQEQPGTTTLHTILALIISAIFNLIKFKFQGKDISPFDKHPVLVWVSVACLLAYWLVYAIEFTNFSSPAKVHCAMTLLGSLLVGSLVSIIFPDSVQLSFFLLYTLLILCVFFRTQLKLHCRFIQQLILATLYSASDLQERHVAQWLVQRSYANQRSILPL